MRKITTHTLAALAAAIVLSSAVEAKTVLSAKEQCFQVLWDEDKYLIQAFKLKPQQPLTDKIGAIVQVIVLDHEWRTFGTSAGHISQLSGAASLIPTSGPNAEDVIQVALEGTSYGTDTGGGGADGKPAIFSMSYSLRIWSWFPAVGFGGLLSGVKTMTPLGGESPTQTIIYESVDSRSCSGI